jgi:hypothetical protein
MSRLNANAVIARAKDLIDGYRPRSFLDAHEIEPPLEWSQAPRARVPAPPEPESTGIEVQETELIAAEVHVVYAIYCRHGQCAKRHMETRSTYVAGSVFVCPRCHGPNRLPVLP